MTQRASLREIDTAGGSPGQIPTIDPDGKGMSYQTPATTSGSSAGTVGFLRLKKSANQSTAAGVWTAVTWDVEDYDTYNAHSTTTNPSRVTVPTTGLWLFEAGIAVGTGGFDAYLTFYVNGVSQRGWQGGKSNPQPLSISRTLVLNANDYVEAFVYQNSGTQSILGTDTSQVSGSILTARLVGTIS